MGVKEVAAHARGCRRHGVERSQPARAGGRSDSSEGAARPSTSSASCANESGRQLRAGRSRTIAYVMLDAANPFFTDVAKGIEEVARDNDVALYLCDSGGDPARETDYLDLFLEQRVRGILVTPVDQDLTRLEPLRRQGVAVALVDRAGGLIVVQRGCRRCRRWGAGGHAPPGATPRSHRLRGGPPSTPQVADRLRGAKRALKRFGGSVRRARGGADRQPRRRRRPAWQASGSSGCPRPDGPTAAFCAQRSPRARAAAADDPARGERSG